MSVLYIPWRGLSVFDVLYMLIFIAYYVFVHPGRKPSVRVAIV